MLMVCKGDHFASHVVLYKMQYRSMREIHCMITYTVVVCSVELKLYSILHLSPFRHKQWVKWVHSVRLV